MPPRCLVQRRATRQRGRPARGQAPAPQLACATASSPPGGTGGTLSSSIRHGVAGRASWPSRAAKLAQERLQLVTVLIQRPGELLPRMALASPDLRVALAVNRNLDVPAALVPDEQHFAVIARHHRRRGRAGGERLDGVVAGAQDGHWRGPRSLPFAAPSVAKQLTDATGDVRAPARAGTEPGHHAGSSTARNLARLPTCDDVLRPGRSPRSGRIDGQACSSMPAELAVSVMDQHFARQAASPRTPRRRSPLRSPPWL